MENSKVRASSAKRVNLTPLASEQGFVLVTSLTLVPLLLALLMALYASFYILKKKSLAQSHCVQQASLLQRDLRQTLDDLLRLNSRATNLRQQRQAADQGLKAALSSANPYVIAAAKAYWVAVFLQQTALASQQQALLRRADQQRQSGQRQIHEQLRRLNVRRVESRRYYWRALAVEAQPAWSLTPDYKTLPLFPTLQQHRFRFAVDLRPSFAHSVLPREINQITECSVTLKGQKDKWKIQVLAASALSNWSWL